MGGARGQSFVWRVAKVAIKRVLNSEIGNKKKPRTDLVKGTCRMITFMPGCNIAVGRPEWSSSHTKLFISFRTRK